MSQGEGEKACEGQASCCRARCPGRVEEGGRVRRQTRRRGHGGARGAPTLLSSGFPVPSRCVWGVLEVLTKPDGCPGSRGSDDAWGPRVVRARGVPHGSRDSPACPRPPRGARLLEKRRAAPGASIKKGDARPFSDVMPSTGGPRQEAGAGFSHLPGTFFSFFLFPPSVWFCSLKKMFASTDISRFAEN